MVVKTLSLFFFFLFFSKNLLSSKIEKSKEIFEKKNAEIKFKKSS